MDGTHIIGGYNGLVPTVSFEQGRACVLSELRERPRTPALEEVELLRGVGRVLAEPVTADRDFPARPRSVRDGFAVRSVNLPGRLRIVGEVRAGESFGGVVNAGEAVEIMTGAPMPDGSDSVVMVEHTSVYDGFMQTDHTLRAGENVNPRASEAGAGDVLLNAGVRLGYTEMALLATVGRVRVAVFVKPRVAILATGDEIVGIEETPLPHQVRNSNSYSLAAQVLLAGGCPEMLPVARDEYSATRDLIERALSFDLVLLSGGVSAGKYDIVEKVLADLGAEFYFDRVLIQPGQPLVFGSVGEKFFFGLPGNPASTMVTFEIFAKPALELLAGQTDPMLPITWARLGRDFKQKTGLTRFLPARLSADGDEVVPVAWQGSSDVAAMARSNVFLVTEPDREYWAAGEKIRVLPR